jgi:thioredoxin 1
MGIINVTAEDFEATIADNNIVLVDWWASWCGPCRMFAPVFEKTAAEHPDIVFATIDTDAESGLADALRIMSIPTLTMFRKGALVFSKPGALSGPALERLIAEGRQLDLGQVHRSVAAQAAC